MKNVKNKLISLSLALTMLTTLSGCKNSDLSLDTSVKEEKLVGEINKDDLNYCYVVEINEYNQSNLYFVYDKTEGNEDLNVVIKKLCDTSGEIGSIIPFKELVYIFGEEKDVYTSNDVEMILHETKKEYYDIKEDNEVKKLELK